MKFKLFILSVAASACCFASPAQKETIEELFQITEVSKTSEVILGQSNAMLKEMTAGLELSGSEKPVVDKYSAKMVKIIKEEAAWDKLKAPIVEIYAATYTEEELLEIIKFYKSPAGQKLLVKKPELAKKTMELAQKTIIGLTLKLDAIAKEMADELTKQYDKNKPVQKQP